MRQGKPEFGCRLISKFPDMLGRTFSVGEVTRWMRARIAQWNYDPKISEDRYWFLKLTPQILINMIYMENCRR